MTVPKTSESSNADRIRRTAVDKSGCPLQIPIESLLPVQRDQGGYPWEVLATEVPWGSPVQYVDAVLQREPHDRMVIEVKRVLKDGGGTPRRVGIPWRHSQ